MLALNQRLSEFSYGYGITREVQDLIESFGAKSVPFLPSLVQEKKLGFDVSFDAFGGFLFLQFKLGSELKRYHRKNGETGKKPDLERPFWRFDIETSDPDGQFRTLLNAEKDMSTVVAYTAPQFSDWQQYAFAFQSGTLRQRSLFVRPSKIQNSLDSQSEPPGRHQVMYDAINCYVRSEPVLVDSESINQIIGGFQNRETPLRSVVERQFELWGQTLSPYEQLKSRGPGIDVSEQEPTYVAKDQVEKSRDVVPRMNRDQIYQLMLDRASNPTEAKFATVGLQAWLLGVQLVAITDMPNLDGPVEPNSDN